MATGFVASVQEAGGFGSAGAAERAVDAVLAALGAHLSADVREVVRAALPHELARRLAGGVPEPFELDALLRDAAGRLGVSPATAKETIEVVLAVLSGSLDAERRERLESSLPPPLRTLAGPLAVAAAAEAAPHHSARHLRQTLASGRPGSERPLSEAHPGSSHAQSVAADNPHGETKLSSASGIQQERTGQTLATGSPGSRRPIGDADE
jgi:uncharacterized protein (DUF2267 family)